MPRGSQRYRATDNWPWSAQRTGQVTPLELLACTPPAAQRLWRPLSLVIEKTFAMQSRRSQTFFGDNLFTYASLLCLNQIQRAAFLRDLELVSYYFGRPTSCNMPNSKGPATIKAACVSGLHALPAEAHVSSESAPAAFAIRFLRHASPVTPPKFSLHNQQSRP
jgi:hypothetical protein